MARKIKNIPTKKNKTIKVKCRYDWLFNKERIKVVWRNVKLPSGLLAYDVLLSTIIRCHCDHI